MLFVPQRIAEQVSAAAALDATNLSLANCTTATSSSPIRTVATFNAESTSGGYISRTQSPRAVLASFEWRSDASLWTAFALRTLAYTLFNPVNSLMDAMSFSVIARVQTVALHTRTRPEPAGRTRSAQKQLPEAPPESNQFKDLSGSSAERAPSATARDETGAAVGVAEKLDSDSTPPAVTIHTNCETFSAETHQEQVNGGGGRALQDGDTEHEARDALLQSRDRSSPLPVAESHFTKEATDGGTKSSGNGSAQQQSAADNAADKDEADKAATQKQRVRAYGLVRACGSLGYIVTASSAAIGTRVLAPDAPLTHTFVVSVAIGDLLWIVASASFFFFRIQRISVGPNLLSDIGKFVRDTRILKIFALLFVEAILFGIIWGNLFM